MRKYILWMALAGVCQFTFGQSKTYSYSIDTAMFASNAGHWYGILDKHNIINPKKHQPRFKANELEAIGDNILLYQKNNGGWPKNYDIQAILTPDQKDSLLNAKGEDNTTFDNGTTYTHVACLAKIYQATQLAKYKDGANRGIEFILKAQFNNGGWPQFYPLEKGYSRHITYNDDAMVGIMNFLEDIKDNKPEYAFIESKMRAKVVAAYNKGIECILNTQIKDNGVLTAWCQQHDEVTLEPAWARAFEPPSICNAESAGIVNLLMGINHPSARVIDAVKFAVEWFKASAIQGVRVKVIAAPAEVTPYTVTHIDRVVVQDPTAPPIWTRYYELKTHRPLFCNRDSKVVYSLAEVARERRSGYGWYTYNPQRIIDAYPAWAQKWSVGK